MFAFNPNQTLYSTLLPKENILLRQLMLIFLGILLLTGASQLSIPLQPVPLTLQTSAIVFIGMIYGIRLGAITVASYLFAGAIGLPVFANYTAGLAIFLGPNAGFLLGFLPATTLSGYLAEHGCGQSFLSSFLSAILGALLIFLCGYSWLAILMGYQKAFSVGVLPFICTEPMKLLFVALLIPKFWKNKTQ